MVDGRSTSGSLDSGSLDVSYEALATAPGLARAAVGALAASHGASAEELQRIGLVVSEAVTNAVLHAYEGRPGGEVRVTAAVIGGELTVVVADDGCGLGGAQASDGLGLGLAVIEQGCDSLAIAGRSSGGTQLEMRIGLRGGAAGRPPLSRSSSSVSCEDR